MNRLTDRTAAELLVLQAAGHATATEITDAFLASIRSQEPTLHAFLHVDEADAKQQAAAIDAKRKTGQPLGPLAGVPIAIKDVICVRGVPTTCGSKILANFRPP